MKQRDAAQVLLFLFLFVLTMITLSQILMVHHSGRYGKNIKTTTRNVQLSKKELIALDRSIEALRRSQVPPIDVFRKLLQNDIYANRIVSIIREASSNGSRNQGNQGDSGGENGARAEIRPRKAMTDPNRTPELIKNKESLDFLNNLNYRVDRKNSTMVPSRSQNLTGGSLDNTSLPGARDTWRNPHLEGEQSSINGQYSNLDMCDPVPKVLLGRVFVNFNHTHNMTRKDVIKQHPDLEFGGMWQPPNCVARHRVAIIIPYRDREQHLVTLLSHLLPILKRQELNFHVFVTEQTGNDTFNKARIMNAAFKEAIKMYDFQCFVFHDVDLIPEDDRNMYSCPVQPRHMSVAIDEMGYRVPYDYLVGGVLSMRTEHFQMVNGYSNLYWGWGAEDDDLAFRILHVGLKITRPPSKVARYKMIKHEKRTPTDWRKRSRLLRTGVRRFNFDGLNSVNYNLISIKKTPLFTHILVDIGKPPSLS
ncbi:beta-1,4-N-acetylgalactosaminyltransferase bre-4-like isoform X2 [Liolophura sinensis]|uniref:beta-1,4-N-acetylgalactosaminyltransferase bre-4-like isoform X2 n=1 Tax=Liolophura sinensis TaxID=3198878 RepID=UPI003158AD20